LSKQLATLLPVASTLLLVLTGLKMEMKVQRENAEKQFVESVIAVTDETVVA